MLTINAYLRPTNCAATEVFLVLHTFTLICSIVDVRMNVFHLHWLLMLPILQKNHQRQTLMAEDSNVSWSVCQSAHHFETEIQYLLD